MAEARSSKPLFASRARRAEARSKTEGIADSWRKDGFAFVETGVSQAFYESAAETTIQFLSTLSDADKKKMQQCFKGEDDTEPGLLGYSEFHPTKPERGTEKVFFHYHPEVERLFSKEFASTPGAERFLASMRTIWGTGLAAALAVVNDLERTNPGVREQLLPSGTPPAFVIRFVLYKKPPEGSLLIQGHHDRSSVTLALAESSPGLRVQNSEGRMNLINKGDGTAVVMAGKGMERIDPSIPLSWHDAVETSDVGVDETHSRWVAVGQLFSGGLKLL